MSAVDAGVEQRPWLRLLQGHRHAEGRQLAKASVLGEGIVETRFRNRDIDLAETQDEVLHRHPRLAALLQAAAHSGVFLIGDPLGDLTQFRADARPRGSA